MDTAERPAGPLETAVLINDLDATWRAVFSEFRHPRRAWGLRGESEPRKPPGDPPHDHAQAAPPEAARRRRGHRPGAFPDGRPDDVRLPLRRRAGPLPGSGD